ncbi:GMP/IMP nucleotidase [Rheinheimera sp. MMS21-TC3]|uniref:GMP/IMP nucleotidase n=1 Tax=Rheinheimera sp. MMS21-TC3 TaxID=3072790 RepID=UPI0028C401A0|nr:GMP/IMP nucleotidase [Rheinheimera sp. MMS21-TC3]WNO59838.1 GMP/IMP nucleotidase [Rheinheimera sp. MMS21-TC3]
MLHWAEIDTVLLDMDGTLLDLHFDNYFWQYHLPKRWVEISGIDKNIAQQQLNQAYVNLAGKLEWYCLDYWSQHLQLPITELKREIMTKIAMRSDTAVFLQALKDSGRKVILLTNAHPDSLALKVECTNLASYIDTRISTHEFGVTKENAALWHKVQQKFGFNPANTLFVDDSLPILQAAKDFGIKHLLAVANPDSKKSNNIITDFPAITDYNTLIADILRPRT